MATNSIRIRYRPLRLGWCVREGNWEDLRKVLRVTHTLWGGGFNPILSLGDPDRAAQLVRLYQVDALFPAEEDAQLTAFAERFSHLRWPGVHKSLFVQGMGGKGYATCLDIYHPVRRIYEEHFDGKKEPEVTATLFQWDAADPLRDVFLAQFGAYPAREEIHLDYGGMVERNLRGVRTALPLDGAVPAEAYKQVTPSFLSGFDLWRDRSPNWDHPGLYVGDAGEFTDIVNFWNLRAASLNMLFFDPQHEARLGEMAHAFAKALGERPRDDTKFETEFGVWFKEGREVDLKAFKAKSVMRVEIHEALWNGRNLKPPLMYIEDERVLASRSEYEGIPSLTFELREKPFYDEYELHTQSYVASVDPLAYGEDEQVTFSYPFLPELNDFYRREVCRTDGVRSERNGLGLITDVRTDNLTIHAVTRRALIANIFEAFGMKSQVSEAGRIALRVIQQMGGVQGCRVFKIAGVRALIEKYKPLKSFTRGDAMQIIAEVDPVTHVPNFSRYEPLFIEPREGDKLKPHQVFDYLVKRNVFRVGLTFTCPNCELEFWTHLDDLATEIICEYCGQRFNVTPQLKDAAWAYRRSGLFGREDHQQGAIPVALTLQQMDTILHWEMLYVASMTLEPAGARIVPCETDLVIVSEKGFYEETVGIAVGECKGRGEITEEDVRKLTQVADAFPKDRIHAYIVFSKTAPFTAEEIARCWAAQPPGRKRVILLSDRELEPYFVYEWAAKEFQIKPTAISLEDLANTTHALYFDPRPKVVR